MMMSYKLVDKNPVPCSMDELLSLSRKDNRLAYHVFGDVQVSTVFLGLEHGQKDGQPILFETMIFGGEFDGYQTRYTNWNDSLIGHETACNLVNKVAIQRDERINGLLK